MVCGRLLPYTGDKQNIHCLSLFGKGPCRFVLTAEGNRQGSFCGKGGVTPVTPPFSVEQMSKIDANPWNILELFQVAQGGG